MPKLEKNSTRVSPRLFLLFLLTVFGVLIYFLFSHKPQIVSPYLTGIPFQPEALPEVPQIYSKNSIFDKIQALQFTSFVNLPVQAGERGRVNPFARPEWDTRGDIPVDGAGGSAVGNNGSGSSSNGTGSQTGGSGNPDSNGTGSSQGTDQGTMSQGSK